MDRNATVEKIIQLVTNSPLRTMFEKMPWWGKWDQLSERGLQKVLDTLEWHRSEIEGMVQEAIATSPEAHNTAYGIVRHADMTKLKDEEAKDDGAWSSDQLLSQI